MTAEHITDVTFTAADVDAFAVIAGDTNPMHVDAVLARRTMYGQCVVHGIYLLLAGLDRLAAKIASGRSITHLKVTFHAPVAVNGTVGVFIVDAQNERMRMELRAGDVRLMSARISLGDQRATDDPNVRGDAPRSGDPLVCMLSDDEADSIAGQLALHADEVEIARLFPNLMGFMTRSEIATLLATTRLVGMVCPGLHSLFVGFDLTFPGPKGAVPGNLDYRAVGSFPKHQMVHLAVTSPAATGRIEAMFRPAPVVQPTMRDLIGTVAADTFSDEVGIVIGGARGLGEVAAKMLAMGGARVVVGYYRGDKDAHAVAAEITDAGGDAIACCWPSDGAAAALRGLDLAGVKAARLVYCAAPQIKPESGEPNRDSLIAATYHKIFVDDFKATVRAIRGNMDPDVRLYVHVPSTAFIDADQTGFMHYCAEKQAAEETARALVAELDKTVALYPRLPRLYTDQTARLGTQPKDAIIQAAARLLGVSKALSAV